MRIARLEAVTCHGISRDVVCRMRQTRARDGPFREISTGVAACREITPRDSAGLGGLAPHLLGDDAHVAELLVATLEQVLDLASLEVAQGLGDVLLEVV